MKNNIDSSLLKVPPQNIEAEQSVLGGILLENQSLDTVLEFITTNDFYLDKHRKIFFAMLKLAEKNEPCDLITLTEFLRSQKQINDVGGAVYLVYLVDNIPSAANINFYAKIVKEKSILRNLIFTATKIITKSYEPNSNIEDLLDETEQSIFTISQNKIKQSFFPIRDLVKESFKTIEKLFEQKELITGIPTGFEKIDEITSGFQNSDLIIIAGRPSMGKTAFALNIAQYVSIETNFPVAIFSLEMSKEQLAIRMLSSEGRVDSQKIRKGFLQEGDWPKLTMAAGRLANAQLFIDDSAAITVLEMKAKARRLKTENGLGLIILDYLQLMKSNNLINNNREQEISEISRSLKALAKELNIPIIALSQLNRRVEDRPHKRPQMADLRESGAIEQDADVIMFIYRDEIYNKSEENPERGLAEIILGKQRNGPIGTIKLKFQQGYTRFENLTLDYSKDDCI